jgi:hypothetical protein
VLQYPWEPYPRREHEAVMTLPTFYMDKYPVTYAAAPCTIRTRVR